MAVFVSSIIFAVILVFHFPLLGKGGIVWFLGQDWGGDKIYTPAGLQILGCGECVNLRMTWPGECPSVKVLSNIHFCHSPDSGISYLKRGASQQLWSLQTMGKGERTSSNFKTDSEADLGPTGNLHLTQNQTIWDLGYFSFAVTSWLGFGGGEKTLYFCCFSIP